ncbi:hypothetical protein CC77DRAFT_23907 [Alternaria alternata]|uniref:Uncharacterized protein n=1 Tax=Alternaria alternata TaxID=5599 RepID=A0A177E310_ALTAL|nr:hypothetical protein CC77DRAFT_23907 [Alternaria alternata]OAG26086.1 hypothetical protein CC77DRAFT_23907 [Alternaria alternata]
MLWFVMTCLAIALTFVLTVDNFRKHDNTNNNLYASLGIRLLHNVIPTTPWYGNKLPSLRGRSHC